MGLNEQGGFKKEVAKEPEDINVKRRIITPVWRLIKIREVSA